MGSWLTDAFVMRHKQNRFLTMYSGGGYDFDSESMNNWNEIILLNSNGPISAKAGTHPRP